MKSSLAFKAFTIRKCNNDNKIINVVIKLVGSNCQKLFFNYRSLRKI